MDEKTLRAPTGRAFTVPGPWRSLAEVKRANRQAGKVFFERGKGPALPELRQGRFIVTADKDFFDERTYHLWAVLDDGRIDQVGEVIGYPTVPEADAALAALILERPELSDVAVSPAERVRPSGLSDEAFGQAERERLEREMIEDPTSDPYHSDGAWVMRRDAGLER